MTAGNTGRGTVRTLGWLVAGAAALSLCACGVHSKWDKVDHAIVLSVRTAAGSPAAGLSGKTWIVDTDVPADSRVPIELEARVTDGEGLAEWTYAAYERPYICGYEIRDSNGNLLESASPLRLEQLNVVPGRLTVTLD